MKAFTIQDDVSCELFTNIFLLVPFKSGGFCCVFFLPFFIINGCWIVFCLFVCMCFSITELSIWCGFFLFYWYDKLNNGPQICPDDHILIPGTNEYIIIRSSIKKLIQILVPKNGVLLQQVPKNIEVALEFCSSFRIFYKYNDGQTLEVLWWTY